MESQDLINYHRVALALDYIKENFKAQPNLDEVAAKVNLSPFHFQKLFSEWAGVSPKKFLQYLSLEYVKNILKEKETSLFDAAHQTGLSGTGRLHDLFINIEGMTPGEFKNEGKNLIINYSYQATIFGNIAIASTTKGVCLMAFANHEHSVLEEFKSNFPKAQFRPMVDLFQEKALSIFSKDWSKMEEIKLHLRGTDFQIKVWETLLKIPLGKLSSYGKVAKSIGNPNASRAVGTAIGDNPVAFLIPCHRVIQSTGAIGQYHWGSIRKTAMIGWEAAKADISNKFK